MPELGRIALVLCLGLSAYAVAAGAYAAATGKRRLALSARNALIACLGATLVSAAVLLTALLRSDFSFVYVADHTSLELPTPYKISAFWGGQEGSLLLWLLILTAYSTAAVLLARRTGGTLVAWVVPVLGIVVGFFSLVLVAVSSPFATQAAPPDGIGLNPSLQNPYMVSHPPALYLGYVGLAVPFAFAMAALFARRTDELWIVLTRRWTLAAWTFLGIGQLLGAHWAYVEVGWGGYFAWDPVENAALMPWLVATAFLHSVMIQEKRGMLKVWNMLLVVGAFCLSLFGTFLTRSGILNSIHSFTGPARRLVPRLYLCDRAGLNDAHPRAPAAPAREDEARVADLARGDVPLQQPAARRFLPDRAVGSDLSDLVGGGARRADDRRPALLQLLPQGVRIAAAPADGDRAARRLATCVTPVARADVRVAGGDRPARRRRPAAARRRRLDPRAGRVFVLGLRPRLDRARVRARNPGSPRALARGVAGGARLPDLAEPTPLRRLRRPRSDRPPGHRRGGVQRVRHDS